MPGWFRGREARPLSHERAYYTWATDQVNAKLAGTPVFLPRRPQAAGLFAGLPPADGTPRCDHTGCFPAASRFRRTAETTRERFHLNRRRAPAMYPPLSTGTVPPPRTAPRRGGRVVECTALEMRHTRKGIGGSNPSLSAIPPGLSPS